MIRLGLNGFGRIGRALMRIAARCDDLSVVAINDSDPNVDNHAYLLRYDTTYGRFQGEVQVDGARLVVDGTPAAVTSSTAVAEVPWAQADDGAGVDVIIDATGVGENVRGARRLLDEDRVGYVFVTHALGTAADITVIGGVNEHQLDPARHRLISTSTCDANACGPILAALDQRFGIRAGWVTTLHPWLSYQNLVDGSLRSVASPTHFWDDFALGRAASDNLIPKRTTTLTAIDDAMPGIAGRVRAFSYRTPTNIVCSADLTLVLDGEPTTDDLRWALRAAASDNPEVLGTSAESLVSSDFRGSPQAAVVDERWLAVDNGLAKVVAWYDNEWGYAHRVIAAVRRACGARGRAGGDA